MSTPREWCERLFAHAFGPLQAANSNQYRIKSTRSISLPRVRANRPPPLPRVRSKERERRIDDVAIKWMTGYANRNLWRMSGDVGLDDLVQDGYLVWIRVARHYQNINERRHLMALFQTAYKNHLHDLSNRRTRINTTVENIKRDVLGEVLEDEVSTAALTLDEAPPAVRKLLTAIERGGDELDRLKLSNPGLLQQACDHFGVEAPTDLWDARTAYSAIAQNFDGWLQLFTSELSVAARMFPGQCRRHVEQHSQLIKARVRATRRD